MRSPEKSHIADREWAEDPVKLFANMYELTEALCHNYWCVLLSPLARKTTSSPPPFSLRPLHRSSPKTERTQTQIADTICVLGSPPKQRCGRRMIQTSRTPTGMMCPVPCCEHMELD